METGDGGVRGQSGDSKTIRAGDGILGHRVLFQVQNRKTFAPPTRWEGTGKASLVTPADPYPPWPLPAIFSAYKSVKC